MAVSPERELIDDEAPATLLFRPVQKVAEPRRILFCYQFCTLGGCETVLRERMAQLELLGMPSHALFLEGGDGQRLFDQFPGQMTIGHSPRVINELLLRFSPDYLVSLDTPQVFRLAPFIPAATKRIIEVHTTYAAGLKYLSTVSDLDLAGIFTPSHEQRQLVKALLAANNRLPIEVVPNPLPEQFHSAEPDSRHERPIVVWVGRLDAHKNWRAFVNVATLLRARRVDAEFWIVGGGEAADAEKAALWKALREGALADRFRWVPRVAHDKMSRLYRYVSASGGCLVSTSQQESFGMVALEAMACGCPVVVPDIGGFRDFVQPNKTGMRYAPGDTAAAEQIIERLLVDRPLWNTISAAGAQQARDEYAAPAATRKLLAALEQVGRRTMRAAA